ncbi:MAG: Txe/YoeB family addiction module toxin [Oscillospiraceae bacterium]|nr:Txe/YoeB family addiction module toxin [Oscillospiraceae bacterium]
MRRLTFSEKGWSEYLYWQENDRKILKRINLLIQDISRNGNDGIGNPEPLRHRDGWSRRIDDANRLVYRICEDTIEILQCHGHYDD